MFWQKNLSVGNVYGKNNSHDSVQLGPKCMNYKEIENMFKADKEEGVDVISKSNSSKEATNEIELDMDINSSSDSIKDKIVESSQDSDDDYVETPPPNKD